MRHGVSMYGAVMAYNDLNRLYDTSLRKYGHSIFRVWATWERDQVGNTVSGYRCINADGSVNATNITRLKSVIARFASWGGTTDVTMGAKAGQLGMNSFAAQKTGVTNLVTQLRGVNGIWCIDVANEAIAAGYSDAQIAELLKAARAADSSRGGLTVSLDGPASTVASRYLGVVKALGSGWKSYLQMYAPHFGPRNSSLAKSTESNIRTLKSTLAAYPLSVYAQEEGRWGYPYTKEQDYYDSAGGAKRAGAVAYIIHNSAGYDLRTKTFWAQLNPTEQKVVNLLPGKIG